MSVRGIGRRGFLELGAGAFFGGLPFPSWADERPLLSFGVLSDVHIALASADGRLAKSYDASTLRRAFERFRDAGADAVVIAGDLAHSGLAGELRALAETWYTVFPNDRAPDGRKVERVFVFGNHDNSGMRRGRGVFRDDSARAAQALQNDPAKWWDEIFHEEWKRCYVKDVKGYAFVGAHWWNGDCNGRSENFCPGLDEFYRTLKIDPSKPFFHIQHPHPRGTVHGAAVWGQDNGVSTQTLSAFPNAVAFSGHSHTSLTDARSVWQGAFTSIACGTLRNVALGARGVLDVEGGFENANTPSGRNAAIQDARKAMKCLDRHSCRQGQFVRVYADRIEIERREFVTDAPLCADIVIPLPAPGEKPFAFERRRANAPVPVFAPDAAAAIVPSKGFLRPTAEEKKRPADCFDITFPAAVSTDAGRVVAYEIAVKDAAGAEKVFAVASEGFRFPLCDARAKAPVLCRLHRARLPQGPLSVEVRAVSCWGAKSAPIRART